MRSILTWPGGKGRLARRLACHLPEHSTYVEPFVGGGAVFFQKSLAKRQALGDKAKWLIDFYKKVRAGGLRKCKIGMKATKANFEKMRRRPDACSRYYTNKLSYHGNMKELGAKDRTFQATGLRSIAQQEAKLKKAALVHGDFSKTMRRFDSKDTLHFLDPPWPVGYTKNYAHKIPLLAEVRRASDHMKGKVMVIYNDAPQVRRAFVGRGWRRYVIHSTQGGGKKGAVPVKYFIATKGFKLDPSRCRR